MDASQSMDRKVTNAEVFGYAFYMFASMFGMITFAFLNMFYPIIGMDMNMFSTALLVARVVDFFVTLFVGGIMEKIHLKVGGGKYRPWLLVFQFIFYSGMVLLFSDLVPGNDVVHFIVVVVGSILVNTSMSFIVTAVFGILPQIAGPSAENRNKMTTWNYRMSTLAMIVTSASGAYIIQFVGYVVTPPTNYLVTTAVFGLFYFLGIWLLRRTAKPYDVRVESAPGAPGVKISDMVKAVTTNSQLLILLLCNTISMIGMMGMMNLMIYYWQLIVPYTHSLAMTVSFPGLYTLGSTITTAASFVFAMVGPMIGNKLGKLNARVIGGFLATLSGVLNFFFAARFWGLYVGISMIATFAGAFYAGFGINYALDCGEYGLWKTGQDHRLVIMSMTNMPMKIAAIFGGFVLYALAAIGFDSGAVQEANMTQILPEFINDGFVTGYMALLCLLPAACNLIAVTIFKLFYKITDENAQMYARENMERMMASGGGGPFGAPAPAPAATAEE